MQKVVLVEIRDLDLALIVCKSKVEYSVLTGKFHQLFLIPTNACVPLVQKSDCV